MRSSCISLRKAICSGVLCLTTLFSMSPVLAQGRFVEDIQISRTGAEAEVLIRLACPMRFQADVPLQSGALLEVRVAPFDVCRQLGGGSSSEAYRPVGGQLARLVEIEYESLGFGDSLLMLHFSQPVVYRVRQRGDLRSLVIAVDLEASPSMTSEVPAEPLPSSLVPDSETSVRPEPSRQPLTSRIVRPETTADYMINLQSTRDAVDPAIGATIAAAADSKLYVSQTTINGDLWHRLRLGFFESEDQARQVLDSMRTQFPRAWVGRAEPEEIRLANEQALDTRSGSALAVISADEQEQVSAAEQVSTMAEPLPEEEVAQLLEDGRNAILDQRFPLAIEIYSRLVQAPGEHRPSASEFLGLAYERSGRTVDARTQYQRFLREFPEDSGFARVQQRLNGLLLASAAPQAPLRSASVEREQKWDTAFGISQYYRRDVNQFDVDQAEVTTLSALFSDIDLSVQRTGESFDMSTRLSMTQMHDLLNERGRGDQERISYAYFDLESKQQDWWLRLGRQSLHSWGVLGRFDGAQFYYGLGPDRTLHVMAGYPVESTRDSIETDRQFYGVAVEFDDVLGEWDISAFLNAQTIEGIDARLAVGTEIRYVDERRSFSSIVDYDVDFGELNTVLMLGTWRFSNRLTLSALVDDRKSPILTARNALIGQPVATIDELLLVWTEEEVRQLAVDRTAESRTVTLGIATPLAERFQLNFDATFTEIGETIASGGVAALTGTGQQAFYSASLVGTSLFKSGDVSIINLRVGESNQFKTTSFTWDIRFPIGRRIRINPRIRMTTWEGLIDGRKREAVSPTLRFLLNTRRHYRIEFEVGKDREIRTDLNSEREATGNFMNLGYRANF